MLHEDYRCVCVCVCVCVCGPSFCPWPTFVLSCESLKPSFNNPCNLRRYVKRCLMLYYGLKYQINLALFINQLINSVSMILYWSPCYKSKSQTERSGKTIQSHKYAETFLCCICTIVFFRYNLKCYYVATLCLRSDKV